MIRGVAVGQFVPKMLLYRPISITQTFVDVFSVRLLVVHLHSHSTMAIVTIYLGGGVYIISSHYLSLTSPYRYFYVTHATRVLQSHYLSGEGIKLWITYILFWPHKDMEGLPGWVISSMPEPPPRQHKQERQYTPSTHSVKPTRRIWNDDYDGQMIFGNLGGLKLPDIRLTGEEKPRKNLTQETCPDRGSNPGPLRDKRACYHLLHSGGRFISWFQLIYSCHYFSDMFQS